MDKSHRYFVQYMLSNGVATTDKALLYCQHISEGKINSITNLKTFIIEINREISKQCFKIVSNTCEVTKRELIVLLNTKNDNIAKLQIALSAMELEYFHAILQEIINSPEHKAKFIVCINITSTLTGQFSRESGQKALLQWLKNGYFVRATDYIYLGIRTIMEFTSYLKTHCPNSVCGLCSELVFTGKQCSSCNKSFHSYCIDKFLHSQESCPSCRSVWSEAEANSQQSSSQNDSNDSMETDDIVNQPSTSERRLRKGGSKSQNSTNMDSDSDSEGPTRRRLKRNT